VNTSGEIWVKCEEVEIGGHHDLHEFSGNCDSWLGVLTLLMIADRRSDKLFWGNFLGAFLLGFLIVFIP
jgi:hypothetical protein